MLVSEYMDSKAMSDYRNNIRDELEKGVGVATDESAITKELVVNILDELGIIQDRTKYKHQKRYLP